MQFKPLEFYNEHTDIGTLLMPKKNKSDKKYRLEVANNIYEMLNDNKFYDLKSNEKLFNFINSYIEYNQSNSIYPNKEDIHPYKATWGKCDYQKHSIFDGIVTLGYVLTEFYSDKIITNKISSKVKIDIQDNINYNFLLKDLFDEYNKKLILFKTDSLISCIMLNTTLSALIEKVLRYGIQSGLMKKILFAFDNIKFEIDDFDYKEITRIRNGNFLGIIQEKLCLLYELCKKYNILTNLFKSIELSFYGEYTDNSLKHKSSLSTLLSCKFAKEIIPNNFRKFLLIMFDDLNLRNDIMHFNSVYINIFSVLITTVMIHSLYLLLQSFENYSIKNN